MEQQAFDKMMQETFGSSSTKRNNLKDAELDKHKNLYGSSFETSQADTVDYISDGDTMKFKSQALGSRQIGYDAYETYKSKLNDTQRRILDRQKLRYAQEFNKPLYEVTDEDINKQGAREGLMSLYNLSKKEDDDPWTPGPVDYYGNNELKLGSKENPLGLPVNVNQQGSDRFDRSLAVAFNPNTRQNLNELLTNEYNVSRFKGDRFDKNSVSKQKDIIKYALDKDISDNDYTKFIMSGYEDVPNEDGKIITAGKNIATGIADYMVNAMDYGAEKVMDFEEFATSKYEKRVNDAVKKGFMPKSSLKQFEDAKKVRKESRDFINKIFVTDKDEIDKIFDVNKRYAMLADKDFDKYLDQGKYGTLLMSVASNLDTHLSNSLPEMIANSGSIAQSIPMYMNRVHKEMNEFEKTTGRKPSNIEESLMWATNAAVMIPERILLVGPLKKIFKKVVDKSGPGLVKKVIKAKDGSPLNSLGRILEKTKTGFTGSAIAVGGTVIGESIQEIADQTQEQFWNKGGAKDLNDAIEKIKSGKVISGREAIKAGVIGGVMGGAIKGAAETRQIPSNLKDIAAKREKKNKDKQVFEAGKYMESKEDLEYTEASQEADKAIYDDRVVDIESAEKALESVESFKDLEKIDSPQLREVAQKAAEIMDKGITFGSKEHKDHIINTIVEEMGEATEEEIQDIENKINESTIDQLKEMVEENSEILSTEVAQKVQLDSRKEEGFKELKSNIVKMLSNRKIKNQMLSEESVEKGKGFIEGTEEGSVKSGKEGTINLSEIKEQQKRTPYQAIKDLVTFNNTAKEEVITELNKYSSEAIDLLEKEIDVKIEDDKLLRDKSKGDPKRVKAINKRIEKNKQLKYNIADLKERRTKSRKVSGLEGEEAPARNLSLNEGVGKQKYLMHIKNILAAKKITDKRDVKATKRLIKSAKDKGFLTERQAEVFLRRLDKIGSEAKSPDEKVISAEKDKKKVQNEKYDIGKKERKIINKNEVSEDDIDAAIEELTEKYKNAIEEDNKIVDTLNEIEKEERTEEQLKESDDSKAKLESLSGRMNQLTTRKYQFSDHEAKLNERYSSLDGYLDGVKEVSLDELTEEESDILNLLNICE